MVKLDQFHGPIPCHLGNVREREEICDEEDDCSWIRSAGIRSRASNRVRHACSSRCPRKLFASLHGRCRVQQRRIQRLRGESGLCPSCGAPHRSPDSPSPWLLNREDDGRRAVTKRVSSVSSGCGRGAAATPESIQARLHRRRPLASTRLRVRCAT